MELHDIIDTEHRYPRHSNRKGEHIRKTFRVTERRYYHELGKALDDGSMELAEPVLAHHLLALRERRAEERKRRRRVRAA